MLETNNRGKLFSTCPTCYGLPGNVCLATPGNRMLHLGYLLNGIIAIRPVKVEFLFAGWAHNSGILVSKLTLLVSKLTQTLQLRRPLASWDFWKQSFLSWWRGGGRGGDRVSCRRFICCWNRNKTMHIFSSLATNFRTQFWSPVYFDKGGQPWHRQSLSQKPWKDPLTMRGEPEPNHWLLHWRKSTHSHPCPCHLLLKKRHWQNVQERW